MEPLQPKRTARASSTRAPEPLAELADCACCPRECHVNRAAGQLGYCRTGAGFSIGAICVHRGEEPVISGKRGICNLFFTRCNLQCRYCQNYQISRNRGDIIEHALTLDEVAVRIGRFLDEGVGRVGFVSPSHCIAQMKAIIRRLDRRAQRPVYVMNTNAYDKVEVLRSLEGVMDVYLPDLKYVDSRLAAQLSDAPHYPEVAAKALKEMYRQTGNDLLLDDEGEIRSGLIIRHLVLPGFVEQSKRCLRFIAEELSPAVHVSLLAQYQPTPAAAGHRSLGRRLRRDEYDEVLAVLEALGFERGWTQELASAGSYQPDFARSHPFER